MNKSKRARLEARGWRIGSAAEFLNLSTEEAAYLEMKLLLGRRLQARRRKKRLTQQALARLLKSSQSRVAKMEAGDSTVSIDLLIRSLLALGTSQKSLIHTLPR